MVKTDRNGKVLKKVPADNHHGDLCYHEGKVYVAVNLGRFNDPEGNADSWVYVYDSNSLELLAKHETQEVFHGAGGIGVRDNRFFVVGGLPNGIEENFVYEYDAEFRFLEKHTIASGWTRLGIQTAAWHDGSWWFGCYGTPKILLKTGADFQMQGRFEFDGSLGIEGLEAGRFLVATGPRTPEGRYTGRLHPAVADDDEGLRYVGRNAEVQLTELDDRIRIEIDGEMFTEWRHRDWVAPYFYPVIGPNGENITRHFPMKEGVEHESQDHPHHRSIRFAHSDVNGLNFWYWQPGRERELSNAEIILEKVESLRSGETGEVVLWNRWLDGEELVLRERMRIVVTPLEKRQVLMDYDIELHAPDGKPVTFGDKKDGGLYVRVAGTMKAARHHKAGGARLDGTILNSLGDRNEATWGRRAEWVDYFGPDAGGKTVGVAMFDHPENLRFPTHWHSRTYGLLTANRFGRGHFEAKNATPGIGDYTLAGGEKLTLRHRFYFHHGDSEAADVAGQYADYTGREWTPLSDGKSFDGWEHGGNWVIEDGAFYRKEKGGSLTYTEALVPDDFELRFDWKVSKGCNSGVYYRPAQYEYQILDNVHSPYGENARQAAGSLFFCMAPSKDATRPFGDWNTGRVKCKGSVIEHWVNGERVMSFDYTDPKWAAQVELLKIRGADLTARGGRLWLQDHGQPVWFRNLRWREIPVEESLTADPDFVPLPVTGEALKKEQARVKRMLEAKKREE